MTDALSRTVPARSAGVPSRGSHSNRTKVSVLVPANDESGSLPELVRRMDTVVRHLPDCEVIVIDDGSVDGSWELLESLKTDYPWLRSARHRSRRGIADALRTGYLAARGEVLVFFPADLQFDPEDIPQLTAPILAGDADMVTGFKQGKYDKAFVSRIYNGLSRILFDVHVRDLNSIKAYRREIMEIVPIRPDWHRYLIVLAASEGFSVTEVPVALHPRYAGKSKFGIGRIPVGVLDMLSVWFELRFGRKPLLLFGTLGAALFAFGVVAGLAAVVRLLAFGVGTRQVWTIIQTCLILGSVFFATGLLGEQIAGVRAQLREIGRRDDEADRTGDD
ncbi:MAG: glycosyltransferase [Gemmatimonadota bacterium]